VEKSASEFMSYSNLPDEVWVKILGFAGSKSTNVMSEVDKRMQALAKDNVTWKKFFFSQWPEAETKGIKSFKRTYKTKTTQALQAAIDRCDYPAFEQLYQLAAYTNMQDANKNTLLNF